MENKLHLSHLVPKIFRLKKSRVHPEDFKVFDLNHYISRNSELRNYQFPNTYKYSKDQTVSDYCMLLMDKMPGWKIDIHYAQYEKMVKTVCKTRNCR